MGYSQVLDQQADMWRFVQSGKALGGMTLSGTTRPDITEAQAKNVLFGATMQTLRSGEPFYWDATTCDLVAATASAIPNMTLRPEDLIAPFGFCWFARPLPLTTPEFVGRDVPLLGYAWGEVPGNGVMLIPFVPVVERPSGGPAQMVMWRYGDSLEDLTTNVKDLALGEMKMIDPETSALRRCEQMRYIAACTAFMNQRILARRREMADRNTRRRLERAGWTHEPMIQVVTLRRAHAANTTTDAAHDPVEWSCQWVVSGHWRQQYYPSTGEHRPLFVLPYIKGPEGLPIKAPAERVFVVSR